jgi:phenylalanyl-tRNA synthetase alpha chain
MAATAVEEALLGHLQQLSISNSEEWATSAGFDHNLVKDVVKSLHGFGYVEAENVKKVRWVLTAEGKAYTLHGSPEVQVFNAVPAEAIPLADLQRKLEKLVFDVGYKTAMKNKWLQSAKGLVSKKVEDVKDDVRNQLTLIQDGKEVPEASITDLKKRKLIEARNDTWFSLKKGPNYAPKRVKPETDLTRDLLQSGEWLKREFKPYNFNALGQPTEGGHLHPLLKVRTQFRNIFLEMGFQEMPTNNFVESSFWNFDALFQPQQHPARDSHDTFFLKAPARTVELPEDYLERVKKTHEEGGYGSIGYGYDWKRDEAEKNLLRTHTTAVSSRMLYKLAQDGFTPKRYFSIDRVFRNEAVDRTHLAEFHQIEGLVCDRGLTLGDLIGVLNEFFARLGIKKLRFKPAYNPYTEPSMEIFSYHEGLKKWVEVGNSGMFRPEMLQPMGLPEDVSVIAWGLSLERPTMIMYEIDNIRDLFGHKVDLRLIKSNPICRLGLK